MYVHICIQCPGVIPRADSISLCPRCGSISSSGSFGSYHDYKVSFIQLVWGLLQCISGWLYRRDKKWELVLFIQVTTAVFISSGFHSAVVTCPNKDNSHFLSPLDNQPEIQPLIHVLMIPVPPRILIQQYFILKLRQKYWILILTPKILINRDPIIRVIAIQQITVTLRWKSEKSNANL